MRIVDPFTGASAIEMSKPGFRCRSDARELERQRARIAGRAIAIARCACARRSAHADEAMKRARFR
jgi:hypothetical protein